MFLLRKRKSIVSPPAVAVSPLANSFIIGNAVINTHTAVGLKGDGEARGVLPFCNTHASMVKPESGGSAF
jgi:hypothetical protein